ncbi:MAG TPA: hypothetical protein VKG01_10300 [Thermoanaerobaculia bacterium]|nr:hypothetical protein [Thermoanaerobaculia bacterium]
MEPLSTPSRSNRTAFLVLLATLAVAALEIWGIRASLGTLLR